MVAVLEDRNSSARTSDFSRKPKVGVTTIEQVIEGVDSGKFTISDYCTEKGALPI